MSRQRSRSPLHSRTSTLLGRRDGYYGEQYHAPVHSDPWRGSENVDNRNLESGVRWDNGSSEAEEQVDHWAKFIEAIGRAEKRKASSMSRYHAQDGVQSFEEDSACSPRRLPRERLCSPETSNYGMETHQRIQSPGQRRNERDVADVDRRYSRSSSPRHSQGKRHDRMEHGYYNEEHEDRYERSSYSERSLKSNYSEHQLHFKGYQDLDPQEEYTVSHRGFSPHCAPVIVEHDHGIPKHDARIHSPGRDRERPRSRDPARERGHPRNHDPGRDRERPMSRDLVRDREQPRSGGPVRDREHPRNRNPVSQREHPRSHDPDRNQEYPRGTGSVRHQEHPRSHDPVRNQEHPRSRDPLRTSDLPRDRGYSKSSEPQRGRDPNRGRESSRSKELRKHGRDYNHHPGTSHDSPSGSSTYHIREDTRFHASLAERGSPLQGMRQHTEQPRLGSHSREPHGQRAVDDRDFRVNESNRTRDSVHDWEEDTEPRGNHGGVLGQGSVLKRNHQHRNPNHPGARMDFAGHETLKIKVDMSRPVGQSSHLGYSSERQLSLDLVNVGRQRLDFLPMLEHSGTFRETPMHSGTFAQEIITLVHQVKENYFQGQGTTLNERFSNEQEYSLVDEFAEEEQEMEAIGPVVNRPLGATSLDTQIFCKIGPMQSQRKPHVPVPAPAPGDLRHDLERKRQERLEGVKITIAGGNFSQILPQSQKNESAYVGDEDPHEAGWSEEVPRQAEHWDDPHQKRPTQNFNARRNFNRVRNRPRPRTKRNANNGARW
ncbi:filaggrin-2 [Pangasianodon hypophthalmus]|uniref:filaggrin-2 n=1 Tax=Pangasianodon hypophthalmus TaxID=310915 RepID=UPI000F00F892|nr:filaggrin-2 [Pangasianodon hypophthalmus]